MATQAGRASGTSGAPVFGADFLSTAQAEARRGRAVYLDNHGADMAAERKLEAEAAAAQAKAQELYNAELAKQREEYNALSAAETQKYKRLDLLSVAYDQNAEAIDKTWVSLSKTKDIGLALDASKPFAFDKKKIDEATTAWERFALGQETLSGVNAGLSLFFGDLDEQSKAMRELTGMQRLWAEETMRIAGTAADSMTGAFVDAFNGIEGGFANLGDVVIREVEMMLARMLVVIPVMNAIGAIIGGITGNTAAGSIAGAFLSYGGARAGGGDVSGGTTYLVGEDGPELFTPRTGGSITPNNRLAALGGKPGNTYNFTYNIPAGVTRADLFPALEATKRATIAEMRELQARGKA
jgi:hypothetical protein